MILPHLTHLGHACPAAVRGVEAAQPVVHAVHAEGGQPRGGQQGTRGAEHVGRLLALLPLGAAVLEPHLEIEKKKGNIRSTVYGTFI